MAESTTVETQFAQLTPGETDFLYEIVDGERKDLLPMGAYQVLIASILKDYMGPFALEHRLGVVVSEMLFVLDAERKTQRRPDLAFVSLERWRQRRITRGDAWDVVPELAIEIVSPTNTADTIDERIVDYFTAGVREVWVFYPETCRVYIHHSLQECHVLDRSGELDGGDILPGFQLKLATLFETVDEP